MPGAPFPANEAERLAALRSYDILTAQRDETLDGFCRVVSSMFGSQVALVSISDSTRQVVKGRVGLGPDELARELAPCAYAILGEQPMVVEDMSRDPRFDGNPLVAEPHNVRFYVGAPLLTPDRLALGTLCAIDDTPQIPSGEKLSNLSDLSRAVMTMLNLRKAMSRARVFAMTDVLTGLANRAGLLLELETLIARSAHEHTPFALIYFDIDNFKAVNDMHGHIAGDDLLKIVADTLAATVRDGDVPGRLGGDEFAVLVPECDVFEADRLARRLFEVLSVAAVSTRYPVGFSIGVAAFAQPPPDVTQAFAIADSLMYSAKRAGKNRIVTLSIGASAYGSAALSAVVPA